VQKEERGSKPKSEKPKGDGSINLSLLHEGTIINSNSPELKRGWESAREVYLHLCVIKKWRGNKQLTWPRGESLKGQKS